MKKFYLTTPLYYVNAKPHIGHSYTNIAADALARYHRLMGDKTLFLTGTDEHGQKIARAAEAAGLPPQAFTDEISGTFRDLWKKLDITYDDFIRTTEARHKKTVAHVWERIKGKKVKVAGKEENVLYQHHYSGFYCVSCETFVTEGVLDPANPGLCPDCKRPLEKMEEDTYFLRISAFQERLIDDINKDSLRILPDSRRNEVLGFLKNNTLKDLSISRPKSRLAWGIPLPFDPDHVTYVWFDALINYVSAVGYGTDDKKFGEWWPADVHIIGKDIIRHHAVLWPILLYALDLSLPKMVFAHGWWVQGGEKMSKSKGNVVDPLEIIAVHGIDAYRYFLLREASFGADGIFSEEALVLRYNTDLANDLGNLLHRTLTMMEKYFGGRIPPGGAAGAANTVRTEAESLAGRVEAELKQLQFQGALAAVWGLVTAANKLIEEMAPWKLAKEKKDKELEVVMVSLCEALRIIAQAVWPFMPATAEKIWAQLGLDAKQLVSDSFYKTKWDYFAKGGQVKKGDPIFPRKE